MSNSMALFRSTMAALSWGVLLTFIASRVAPGFGGLVLGIVFDGLWDLVYTGLLQRFGKPDLPRMLADEARRFLEMQDSLHGFELIDLEVRDATAIVKGRWPSRAAEDAVRSVLLRVDGIDKVTLLR